MSQNIKRDKINYRIVELKRSKLIMLDYLKLKLSEEDYHGVEDAASDIRDIESAIFELEALLND